MNRFTSEQELLSQVREVQAHISDGLSPSDAIVKVAQDRHTHPDMLPLLVQSCNLGRQAYQQEKHAGGGALGLVAEFPLADLDHVKAALYPADPVKSRLLKTATAVSDVYDAPPAPPVVATPRTKAAAAVEAPPIAGDLQTTYRMKAAARQAIKQAVHDAEIAVHTANDRFVDSFQDLIWHFKQADHRSTLPVVDYNCRSRFGEPAADLFTQLRQYVPAGAAAPEKQAAAVNFGSGVYALVDRTLKLAGAHAAAVEELAVVKKGAEQRLASLSPFFQRGSGSPTSPASSSLLKAGSWITPLLTGAAAGAASNMRNSVSPANAAASIESELDDPDHLDELRGIQSRAMLAEMLNNDQVISGYAPEEVTNAYNEMVQLSPSAADQPALMRPLLRKRLSAGGTEPFDAQQIADIEKTVQQTRSPVRSVNGPSRLG